MLGDRPKFDQSTGTARHGPTPCSQTDHSLPRSIPSRRTGACPDRALRTDRVIEQIQELECSPGWHAQCSMVPRVRRLGGPPETWPRTRLFERRDGGSGQEARAGRQPDSRQANPRSRKTPGAGREGFFAAKVEGGGDAKAFPGGAGRAPGGAGSPRGARIGRDLIRPGRHRTRRGEQGPEGGGAFAGRRRVRPTPGGHESAGETRYGSAARDKPLKGKPWTWQRDGTSPRRRWAEETVEDVRNVEGGTYRGVGIPRGVVDAGRWCRDEGRGPQGRRSSAVRLGREVQPGAKGSAQAAGLCRRREARGRMKPHRKMGWTADDDRPRGSG